MNLISKVPLQITSPKSTNSQNISSGKSPFMLQSTEQLRLVRSMTTEQRQQPAQSMQQLVAASAALMVGVHPKMLKRRTMMRITSDQGMMNLACDSKKSILSPPSPYTDLRTIVMMALVAKHPKAIAQRPSVVMPFQLYHPISSQILPKRQRAIVITSRML